MTDWSASRVISRLSWHTRNAKTSQHDTITRHHDPEFPAQSPRRGANDPTRAYVLSNKMQYRALSAEVAPESPATTPQHGLQDRDQQLSLLPRPSEEQGEPEPSDSSRLDASRESSRDRDGGAPARLSPASPAPRDRITEYENALVQTPRKRYQGPVFEVIKSARKPDDKSCPIAKLPNGESLEHVSALQSAI